jgi:ABC-type siderophore export system fused ATPase/permease subunit
MSIYLCRWSNGDLSIACGKNRLAIEDVLDEVGDPGSAELTRISHPVAVHFHLKQNIANNETVVDSLELEGVDELLISEVCDAYPILDKVLETENATPEEIAAAVEQEHERVKKTSELSDDPNVARVQLMTGMSKRLAEAHNETAKAIAAKRDKK